MDRSQYLVRALEQIGQPAQSQSLAPPDLGAMKQAVGQRQAWEAQNPGQSHLKHSLGQAGQAVMGAPQNALANLQSLMGMGAKRGGSAPS